MRRASSIVIIFLSILYLFITFNRADAWKYGHAVNWDKSGYYMYLPAIFIYDDLDQVAFYDYLNGKYHLTGDWDQNGAYKPQSTGRHLNKYPAGIAVLEAPFFFISHAITLATGSEVDGFSQYYQLGVYFATIFWVILGFIALRNWLRRYYGEGTVATVILLIGLATNLYHYTAFDPGMSHPFSFALFAFTLNWMDRFYASEQRKYLLFSAISFGLIVIARPTNVMLAMVLLFMGIASLQDLKARIALWGRHFGSLFIATLIFVAVLGIQLSYWKYITGHWVYYAYQEEGFNFRDPQIFNGLFSYRKGWLLYTPLGALCLLGILPLWKQYPKFAWSILLYMCVHIYVVFSWYQWFYGGGFGGRAMIETYAVLALPLAALLHWAFTQKLRVARYSLITICSLCLVLNVWQTYQFSLTIIPWDRNTKEYYWKMFFRLQGDSKEWDKLGL